MARKTWRSLATGNHRAIALDPIFRHDAGDTLLELIIATVLFSIVTLSVFLGFGTLISGSSSYRNLATMNSALMSASTQATSELQVKSPALFKTCANGADYGSSGSSVILADYQPGGSNVVTFSLPSGYTAKITKVLFWDAQSGTFSTSCSSQSTYPATATGVSPGYSYYCPSGGLLTGNGAGSTCDKTVYAQSEKITVTVTNTTKNLSGSNSFVVIDPSSYPNYGDHLQILRQPAVTTSCPTGYTYSGGTCTQVTTIPATAS